VHIPRRPPKPLAGISLSDLRRDCHERGLEVAAVADVVIIRAADQILHRAQTLGEVRAWLAAAAL
jgi:hypothetical protein